MKIITFDDIHQKEYYNKLCYEFISKYKNRKLISIVKPIIDEDIEGITDYNAAIIDRSEMLVSYSFSIAILQMVSLIRRN
jgi:hypothetical protein